MHYIIVWFTTANNRYLKTELRAAMFLTGLVMSERKEQVFATHSSFFTAGNKNKVYQFRFLDRKLSAFFLKPGSPSVCFSSFYMVLLDYIGILYPQFLLDSSALFYTENNKTIK
jgi:hypothetical protein